MRYMPTRSTAKRLIADDGSTGWATTRLTDGGTTDRSDRFFVPKEVAEECLTKLLKPVDWQDRASM